MEGLLSAKPTPSSSYYSFSLNSGETFCTETENPTNRRYYISRRVQVVSSILKKRENTAPVTCHQGGRKCDPWAPMLWADGSGQNHIWTDKRKFQLMFFFNYLFNVLS